jgi:hypothetical protein
MDFFNFMEYKYNKIAFNHYGKSAALSTKNHLSGLDEINT